MRDVAFWAVIAAVLAGSLWATCSLQDDCDKRGGVLVKGLGDVPACVAAPGGSK